MKVLLQCNEHKFLLVMHREIDMILCCKDVILSTLQMNLRADKGVMWSTHADFSEQTNPESYSSETI